MPILHFSPPAIRNRYLRAQMVAVLATGVDFAVTILLREWMGIPYVTAVGCGACCGAITAFFLNRNWTFSASGHPAFAQAARFALALAGSAALNTAGTWWVTETFGSHYLLSKTGVAVFIGLTYSWFILKFFVFAYEKR